MSDSLPILTDDEVRRVPTEDDAGFGALATGKGLLPLLELAVQTRIDGLLARTTVIQRFVNALDEPLEATYIFPLPDRAAVTSFRMKVAGRVVEGVLQERGEARRQYDQAIQSGQRAGIAEEDRPGVFTLRVGNLMPGEEATIRLTLTGPLAYDAGEATFRFPLVVAPRYIPGMPLSGAAVGTGIASDTDAVPDASRITPPVLLPGFPSPVHLSLSVELNTDGLPVGEVRSSLRSVVIPGGTGVCRVVVEPGERLDRDFILRFRVGADAVRTALVLQPDSQESKEGTFLLTLVPPAGQAKLRPRDVIFILDRSGSMGGWKIVAARRALARMVDTLTDQDCFTVYAFDDRIEAPAFSRNGLVAATDRNRFRAVEFLARIESRGGTEMAAPLDQAVGLLAKSEPQRDRILVLVTDGQVGNEDQILRQLGQRVQGLRIFTLGIDQAVNAAFLKRLASQGGGCCELVESEDRLDEVMDRIHRRIGTPLLTGLRLEPAGLELERPTLVPGRLPDLFAQTPLFILGRYQGAARGGLLVQASDEAGRPWSQMVTGTACGDSAVTSVWARGHVRELEDRYVTGRGEPNVLMKQIVNTSLRFGVLCRFTAFVAVDVQEVVNPSGQVHRMTQPVESAAGWAMLGTDGQEQRAPGLNKSDPTAPSNLERAGGRGLLLIQTFMDEVHHNERGNEITMIKNFRREIEKLAPPGPDMVTMGKLPQTPSVKKVIEQAAEEAQHLNHRWIGTEHLLLGLLREPESVAVKILLSLGLNPEEVRKEVLRLLGKDSEDARPAGLVASTLTGTYEQFTGQARKVMQLANQEAQRLNHDYISTEHILLGLIGEGSGVAAIVLKNLQSRTAGGPTESKDEAATLEATERRETFWK